MRGINLRHDKTRQRATNQRKSPNSFKEDVITWKYILCEIFNVDDNDYDRQQ